MELLKDRIRKDGHVRGRDVLKVDSFLNHQIDVAFLELLAQEFARRFAKDGVNKILTIEASGIAIACMTARFFQVPVVFAKKNQSKNIDASVFRTPVESFTHGRTYDVMVSRSFLGPEDRVLIVDDFLANGKALEGLCTLVEHAGATVVGAGIVIEKAFQNGGERLRSQGIRIESLARILSMDETEGVAFC